MMLVEPFVRTRTSLLADWYAAQKVAEMDGAIVLNHESAAGFLLDQHVVASIALALCPSEPWWDDVRGLLRVVLREEQACE